MINNYGIRLSHDIKNYSDRSQAEADNIDRGLNNS